MQLRRNKEMEFETLKKNYKKQIIIGVLAICIIGGSLTFATTRAKYKLTQDIPLARGTVNYNPDRIAPTISNVTASVTKTEITITVTASDNVGVTEYWYQIGSNTAVKGTGNTHKFIGLTVGTTYSIKVYVKDAAGNQSTTTTKSATTSAPTSEDTLTKLNITSYKTTAPNFSQVATTDEGIYRVSDEMYGGYSYYWRGAVTNNYVKFANFCWRIVRINGDGSIRLIYDGATCHANGTLTAENIAKTIIAYNTSSNNSSYVGWTYTASSQRPNGSGTASNAKTQLESWYNSNITGTNANKVADGKYCNDRTSITSSGGSYTWAATGSTFYYGAYHRINTGAPTLSCPNGDIYSLKVGLITADEVMYAGGKFANNSSYYLYNGQHYWAMSPCNWDSGSSYTHMFLVNAYGFLNYSPVLNTYSLRPVINLKSDVTFSSGDGTQNNPYVVQ